MLVGVIDEDPFEARTWSGSSAYFFGALKERGSLYAGVAATPPKVTQRLYQAVTFHPDMRKWRFKYHLNTRYRGQMTRAARRAMSSLDPDRYDVILQVGAWYDMTGYRGKRTVSYHDGNLALLLASPYGYPRISKSYIKRTLAYERDLYGRLDLIFPMSRWLADSFVRDFGVPAEKIFPVGAGVNLSSVPELDHKSYEAPRLLFVGKDFSRKGGQALLRAFEVVRREVKNAELTIIGPELNSPFPGVRCLGFISKASPEGAERIAAEYSRATAFVLPSLYEPFGVAFVEAMAHRLPCIGTNICAMPEIIQENRTGFLVPPGDEVALADRILALLKDPAACRALGDAGRERYTRHYTWQAVADRICETIGTELSRSP